MVAQDAPASFCQRNMARSCSLCHPFCAGGSFECATDSQEDRKKTCKRATACVVCWTLNLVVVVVLESDTPHRNCARSVYKRAWGVLLCVVVWCCALAYVAWVALCGLLCGADCLWCVCLVSSVLCRHYPLHHLDRLSNTATPWHNTALNSVVEYYIKYHGSEKMAGGSTSDCCDFVLNSGYPPEQSRSTWRHCIEEQLWDRPGLAH